MSKAIKGLVNLSVRSTSYVGKKWPVVKRFMLVEMRPISPMQTGQYFKEFGQACSRISQIKHMTVHEALISFIVTWEVVMWFFLGEQLGRVCICGYRVEGAEHFH